MGAVLPNRIVYAQPAVKAVRFTHGQLQEIGNDDDHILYLYSRNMNAGLIYIYTILPKLPYLNLDWPAEVSHVNVEGDVVVKSEVELLAREAVAVLLNVGPGYDWHLFAWDRPGWNEREKNKY